MSGLNRMERECLEPLRTALRIKDTVSQGQIVSADAYDLLVRAEDVLMSTVTGMTFGQVVETREVRQ